VYRLRTLAAPADGLPPFTSTTTIRGNGATIVRKSTQQFRILDVSPGAQVTISSLTIKGGHAPDGITASAGGGILNFGTLTLRHVTVSRNAAGTALPGGIVPSGGFGGGIYNIGTLNISRSRIVRNRAGDGPMFGTGGGGGGIVNQGALLMTRTTIAHNATGRGAPGTAGGNGGGLYESLGTLTVSHSVITANTAVDGGHGGGVYNGSLSPIALTRTRIVRNRPDNCAGFAPVANCRH
jgi:hypothetical protein